MAREPLKNIGASVRARLLQRSRDERTDFVRHLGDRGGNAAQARIGHFENW